jgi:HAMP domain-containing protein
VFVLLNLAQLAVLAAFMLRDRNRRLGPRARHARAVN